MTAFDRDEMIRLALAPADAVRAPESLADDIERAVAVTPQRRSPIPWTFVARWIPSPSPTTVLAALLSLLVLLGVLMAVASRRPQDPPGLTTYHGGPDRTGVMPGPGPAGPPAIAWSRDLQGRVPVTVMPVVVGGRVYVADADGLLWAFESASGALVGQLDIGSAVESSPTVVGDALIVGAIDGGLTAVDLLTFNEQWGITIGGPIRASLAAIDGALVVGSDDGNLYVIDPATGSIRLTIACGGPILRGPAIADGIAYVGTASGTFLAVHLASGSVRWSRSDLGPGVIGTPAVVGDTVFLSRGLENGAAPHAVLALDTSDGGDRWNVRSEHGDEYLVGAVGGGTVFIVSKDGFVYAVDQAAGTERWRHGTGAGIGALAGLVDDTLYITNDRGMVMALDAATGEERWAAPVAGTPGMAAVIDGQVIVSTTFGKLIALADPVSRASPR